MRTSIVIRLKRMERPSTDRAVWWGCTALLAMLLVSGGQNSIAGESPDHHGKKADAAKTAQAVAEEGPSMEEMMAMMQEKMAPNEHHAHMAKAVGKWNAVGKFWMSPEGPPMETTATAVVEPVFGGRYFRMTYDSEFMGAPFHGISMDGYDTLTQKHVGTWIDSMSTGVMTFEGTCEDNGKRIISFYEGLDPMMETPTKTKTVAEMNGPDKMTFSSYMILPDDSEMLTMQITYTRVK